MHNYMDIISVNARAQIADDPAFDLADDLELRLDLHADWATGSGGDGTLVNRWVAAGNNREWRLWWDDSDLDLVIGLGTGAGAFRGNFPWNGFSALGLADAERVQVRMRLDADNGAAGTDIEWSYRTTIADLENNAGWTVDETDTAGGVQAWKATTNTILVGNDSPPTNVFPSGWYGFAMWTDLTQTTKVAGVDFTDETTIDAGATDDDTWNDDSSANDWVMGGTHETNWDYIRLPHVARRVIRSPRYGITRMATR